jgi:hypothetical protein
MAVTNVLNFALARRIPLANDSARRVEHYQRERRRAIEASCSVMQPSFYAD